MKKLIPPVAMKLKKFHACLNHCILYRGKYENLQSCPHCGASRYKRNVGCHADADDERGPKKKKKTKKSTTKKQIPSPEDEEEEGYTQRKSLTLSMWYLPMIDRLRDIFKNPEDAKLLSWHASDEPRRTMASCDTPPMASSGSVSTPSSWSLATRRGTSGSR